MRKGRSSKIIIGLAIAICTFCVLAKSFLAIHTYPEYKGDGVILMFKLNPLGENFVREDRYDADFNSPLKICKDEMMFVGQDVLESIFQIPLPIYIFILLLLIFVYVNNRNPKIKKRLIAFLLIWMLAHCVVISIDGFSDNGEDADYAVVLGNKVNEDGSLSLRLEKRMECALNLYKSGRIKGFVVSGGWGKEGHYEGEKMREYLLKHGVPDSLVVVDNNGTNTRNTISNTLNMQDTLHYNSLIVVSQYYHITRTKALFRKAGFQNVSGVSPRFFEMRDVYSLLREFAAFYTQCL